MTAELALCTVVSVVVAVEILILLNFRKYGIRLASIIRKALRIIAADSISDHWKEKALLFYSKLMFTYSIRLFYILFLSLSPLLLIGSLSGDFGKNLLLFMLMPSGIFVSTLSAFVYVACRKIIAQ